MTPHREDSSFGYELQSVEKEYNKKKSKFRNQIKIESLGMFTLEFVLTVLRDMMSKPRIAKKE